MISFGWIQEFLSYILDSKNNLVNILYKSGELQENELIDLYNNIIKNKENSPCISDPFKSMKITVSNRKNNSLSEIKNKEKELNNPYLLYKIFIRKIENKDIIGIEDSLELKQRFCYVKCISENAVIQKVSLFDMFKLINLSIKRLDLSVIHSTQMNPYINLTYSHKLPFLLRILDTNSIPYEDDEKLYYITSSIWYGGSNNTSILGITPQHSENLRISKCDINNDFDDKFKKIF